MATRETDHGGLGAAVKELTQHASSWFRLERELASLEIKNKITSLGIGLALALGAAVVALYAIGFLFATAAAALAEFLPTWLALLIVTLSLFMTAAALGLLAVSRIKRGTPPVPEQALKEVQLTKTALKGDGR